MDFESVLDFFLISNAVVGYSSVSSEVGSLGQGCLSGGVWAVPLGKAESPSHLGCLWLPQHTDW